MDIWTLTSIIYRDKLKLSTDFESQVGDLSMSPAFPHRCPKTHDSWSHRDLSELIDHIVQVHHAYLRRELPKLNHLAWQCAANPPPYQVASLIELQRILSALTQELMLHMHKEELVLFPRIRQIESAGDERVSQKSSLAGPIGMMEQEHRFVKEALARLRWLTDHSGPVNAHGDEYRLLLVGLAELEADLGQHIHEENDLLFPRAMELEAIVLLIA
jgi:regulator of cell morphogenesis and NO signaling